MGEEKEVPKSVTVTADDELDEWEEREGDEEEADSEGMSCSIISAMLGVLIYLLVCCFTTIVYSKSHTSQSFSIFISTCKFVFLPHPIERSMFE